MEAWEGAPRPLSHVIMYHARIRSRQGGFRGRVELRSVRIREDESGTRASAWGAGFGLLASTGAFSAAMDFFVVGVFRLGRASDGLASRPQWAKPRDAERGTEGAHSVGKAGGQSSAPGAPQGVEMLKM